MRCARPRLKGAIAALAFLRKHIDFQWNTPRVIWVMILLVIKLIETSFCGSVVVVIRLRSEMIGFEQRIFWWDLCLERRKTLFPSATCLRWSLNIAAVVSEFSIMSIAFFLGCSAIWICKFIVSSLITLELTTWLLWYSLTFFLVVRRDSWRRLLEESLFWRHGASCNKARLDTDVRLAPFNRP